MNAMKREDKMYYFSRLMHFSSHQSYLEAIKVFSFIRKNGGQKNDIESMKKDTIIKRATVALKFGN